MWLWECAWAWACGSRFSGVDRLPSSDWNDAQPWSPWMDCQHSTPVELIWLSAWSFDPRSRLVTTLVKVFVRTAAGEFAIGAGDAAAAGVDELDGGGASLDDFSTARALTGLGAGADELDGVGVGEGVVDVDEVVGAGAGSGSSHSPTISPIAPVEPQTAIALLSASASASRLTLAYGLQGTRAESGFVASAHIMPSKSANVTSPVGP